jgi:4'-phosphopantetheinyl transferase
MRRAGDYFMIDDNRAARARALPTNVKPPMLEHDHIHLWTFELDGPPDCRLAAESLLDHAEVERSRRFVRPVDRDHFCIAHGVTRMILAGYLRERPADLGYRFGSAGKPALDGFPELQFNLSHSGAWGLLAVTRVGPVGVDIECVREMPDLMEIARENFAPKEVATLKCLPEAQRLDAFFAGWTRKEAFVKTLGDGLPFGLDGFEVEFRPDHPARLLQVGGSSDAAWPYLLHALRPVPGTWAAVSVEGRATELVQLRLDADWQGVAVGSERLLHREGGSA